MWRASEFYAERDALLEHYEIDPEPFDEMFRGMTENLNQRDPYFHLYSGAGSIDRPEDETLVDSIGISNGERGYVATKVDETDDWAEYAILSFEAMEFGSGTEVVPAATTRMARFEYDELPDPSVSPQSRQQFYFDIVSAVDRRPEEMIEPLAPDFTPDYRLPEEFQSEYGRGSV